MSRLNRTSVLLIVAVIWLVVLVSLVITLKPITEELQSGLEAKREVLTRALEM